MHKQRLPYLTVKHPNLQICAATTNTGEMTCVRSCDYMILAVLYQSMGFSLFHDCSNCFISSVFCLSKSEKKRTTQTSNKLFERIQAFRKNVTTEKCVFQRGPK
jgi:hypothetical protein